MYKWKVCPIQGRQLKDVREEDLFEEFRICNTYRGGGGYDQFPEIAVRRIDNFAEYKGNPSLQFVVQLYGCVLDCPYCYVTRDGVFGNYTELTTDNLINAFMRAHERYNVGVFHLMGGSPALYHKHWHEILDKLPKTFMFHSDLLLTEMPYDVKKLKKAARPNALYAIDIKGVNPLDYKKNTRRFFDSDLFYNNFRKVIDAKLNFYLTFTNPYKPNLREFKTLLSDAYGSWVLDDSFVINLVNYEALK